MDLLERLKPISKEQHEEINRLNVAYVLGYFLPGYASEEANGKRDEESKEDNSKPNTNLSNTSDIV